MTAERHVTKAVEVFAAAPEAPAWTDGSTLSGRCNLTRQALGFYTTKLVFVGALTRKELPQNSQCLYQKATEPSLEALRIAMDTKRPHDKMPAQPRPTYSGGLEDFDFHAEDKTDENNESERAARLWDEGFRAEGKTWGQNVRNRV